MDADNLKEIGHKGFTVDAQAMTAVLFDFATHADYRAAVKKEFDGIKALFGEYQAGAEEGLRAADGAGREIGIRVRLRRSPGSRRAAGVYVRPATSCRTRSAGQSTCAHSRSVAERADDTGCSSSASAGHDVAAPRRNAGRCVAARNRRPAAKIDRGSFAHPRGRLRQRAVDHRVDQRVADRPLQDTPRRAARRAAAGAARRRRRPDVNHAWPVARS